MLKHVSACSTRFSWIFYERQYTNIFNKKPIQDLAC